MVKIGEVMRHDPPAIDHAKGARDAALLMAGRQSGYLIVTDGERPVGIVTSLDLVSRLVAAGLDPDRTPIRAIMSQPIYTARPWDDLGEEAAFMAKVKVRRLAVVDGSGKLVGAVTLDDIAMLLAKERDLRDPLLNALCQYSEPPSGMPYL